MADDVSRIIRSESKRQRHGGESKGDDGERSCEPMSIIDALMDDEGGEEEEGPWGGLSEHEYMEVLQALEESIRRDMESEGACVAVGWFWLICAEVVRHHGHRVDLVWWRKRQRIQQNRVVIE